MSNHAKLKLGKKAPKRGYFEGVFSNFNLVGKIGAKNGGF
jgi:hypothetical protein